VTSALPYSRRLAYPQLLACFWLLVLSTAAPALTAEPKLSAPQITAARIGFEGVYKLGCWAPLEIEIQGGSQAWTGQLVVSAADTDGVPTRVVSQPNQPLSIQPEQSTSVRLFVRVGQSMHPLDAKLITAAGQVSATRTFYASGNPSPNMVPGGLPATNRILLEFGSSLDLGELVQSTQTGNSHSDQQLATRVARVEQAVDLPGAWYGYESIDTVLLTTSNANLYHPLLKNRDQLAALSQWVERGGRLVLFCAANAEKLLSADGLLASFAPGRFEKMERLSQPQPLATFSGSAQPIARNRRVNFDIPSLLDVRGQILASAGRSATTVPLVVRTPRGFGEVVFVGLDFDRPPLSDWAGRTSFLRRVLDWQDQQQQETDELADTEDLSGHLRNSLDKKFVGVTVIPFALVAGLAGLYILLLGPGDYFFVKRILRRTHLTWLTFPLVVIAISATAFTIANRMKGDQLRVNQIEIVDVDLTAGLTDVDLVGQPSPTNLARGVVWTHFFTPEVSELNLHLEPHYLGKTDLGETALDESKQLVSWLGLPGYALGGMQASGAQTAVFDTGYQYGDGLASLQQLPVQIWSTKTLTARWSARVTTPLQATLTQTDEELLSGQLTNQTDQELVECLLLHGKWAYSLGRLPAGKSRIIDDSLQPRTVKTLLTSATAGDVTATNTQISDDGTVPFQVAEWDIARLVKSMMFYDAINGRRYTGKMHRYQSFVDLSHLLKYEDRAILLAKGNTAGSQWLADASSSMHGPLASDQDRRWTYYRFVLKVESPELKDSR